MIFKALFISRKYTKLWRKLGRKQQFKDSLESDINPPPGNFKAALSKFFGEETFNAILYLEMAKRLVEIENPDLVLIACEYCPPGRSAVIACKMKGIPSLALQHGIIHPYHGGYFHIPEEVSGKKELTPRTCPLPDKTAVYGPFVLDVLTKEGNYPEALVVVTGQPRYDVLIESERHFNKQEFCRKYALDPNKKMALLITQTFPEKRREAFLRPTLKALKKLPDIQILIKPHPGEDALWNKKIAQNEGVDVVLLAKTSSIYEALHSCDIMLTVNSTAAIEAIIMDKPVVIVNLTKEIDPIPYVQSGAALGANREIELLSNIKKVLYDKNTNDKLREARKRFINEHAYKLDGRSTQRVVEVIEEMIRQ